ncbi:glycosyltransferase family 4 protein [Pectobacterium polaris]|uniref:Glycosyltransferase family 1 protein n=1 Tax=Pectobacterium polaris TaxID=2042057 RepID=A0AAW5G8Q5_9GAMM|nr:glycosyltransferase family 4 protein [Pectobacterium polaris]MCL6349812.1 glycosyltransferase family 1 protein [Pectobacterium polaris]MCL6367210.1 glycosyltransferase family 1 protein [Pectobacterium polaris]
MKVLYIITKASEIGGAQVHVKDLSERLVKDGHSVEVIVGESGVLVDELLDVGVSVHVVNNLVREIAPKKDIVCVINLRKLINNINPDIVALHSSKAGIVGRLAMLFKKTPVVFTAHGWAFADGVTNSDKRKYILIERIFSKIVDKIITVSYQDKNLALKYKVASEEKQIVIHNGIPESKNFRENSNNTIIKMVSIARFSKQKDHITLFKALKLLNRKDYHLDLLGTGPLLNEMKKMVNELELSDRVSFLGERRDIANILSKEDIFILSSNWEGLPLSLLEAMRESLPIIASDVGGISECVKDHSNGYLTKRGDAEDLAAKITVLLEDKELRLKMGKTGREIFENNFIFDVMYEKTISVYKNLIEAKL